MRVSFGPASWGTACTRTAPIFKEALEWDVIERMPCVVRLLPIPTPSAQFHNFADYERLVDAAERMDRETHLFVLLGGDAGVRCGEMMALQWADVDLHKRQICVQHSDWKGQVTSPKGRRLRYVPMTVRLATALRDHRHLRSKCVLGSEEWAPADSENRSKLYPSRRARGEGAARGRTRASTYLLFASHDAGRPGEGDPGTRRTPGSGDHTAVDASEPGRDRGRDSAAGSAGKHRKFWRHCGDGVCRDR